MKYNHFDYCESLARRLKPVRHTDGDCHYFRATEQSNLTELERNISAAHGMILIAIDGKISEFDYQPDSMIEKPIFGIVIANQTDSTDIETVFKVQDETKKVALQVISRMMFDARGYRNGCEYIAPGSFLIEGFGPISGNFYGVILSFNLSAGLEYMVNPDMWL